MSFRPLQQSIPIPLHKWEQLASKPLVESLSDLSRGTITRNDVLEVGQKAKEGVLGVTDFFVAIMMWGYGEVGYGPWRVSHMLQKPNLEGHLKEIIRHLCSGSLREAYNKIKIPRCGPAFFTKLFYFVGLTFGVRPLPLILDARVAKSLVKCRSSRFDPFRYGIRMDSAGRSAEGYWTYVREVNRWAEDGGFTPDQIEMFLFEPPPGF